jgi:Flp pilus assembly pilin Flp
VRAAFRRLSRQDSGADLVEYALLVALFAAVVIGGIYAYSQANSNTLNGAADGLNAATPTSSGSGGGSGGSGGSTQGSGGGGGTGSGHGSQGGSGGNGGSGGGYGNGGGGQGGQGGFGGQGGSGGSGGGVPTNPHPLGPPQGGVGDGSQ